MSNNALPRHRRDRDRVVRRAGPDRRAQHHSGTNDNGIEILRNAIGDDGTLVSDNRIEDIKAGPGGSGQYGNAINAFRAGNVIVRGNRIRNCDYSGGARQLRVQHPDRRQQHHRRARGRALFRIRVRGRGDRQQYRGRLAPSASRSAISTKAAGSRSSRATSSANLCRSARPGPRPDDDGGVGIYVEADGAVTGNVIENAPTFGIVAGWGKYLRDVVITGNVIRKAFVGIGISVASGAGAALVDNNVISEAPRGAVVGLDHFRAITTDLSNRRRGTLRAGRDRHQPGAALKRDDLKRDELRMNRHRALASCLAISPRKTLRVRREGKPLRTFPDHALATTNCEARDIAARWPRNPVPARAHPTRAPAPADRPPARPVTYPAPQTRFPGPGAF